MKILKRSLLVLFTLVCLAAFSVLAACGNKNNKDEKYTLTLDPDGGTLATTSMELDKGANVFDAVESLVPVKGGYNFIAWYEGAAPVAEDRTMDSDLTLKAHYSEIANATVSYNSNAPRGTTVSGSVANTVANAAGEVTIAKNGYTIAGYRFAGWGTSATGGVVYVPGATVTLEPETTLTLYAVWDKGYEDRFGGSDYIYLPRNEEGVAILSRGAAEFRGELVGDIFTFERNDGEKLTGKVFHENYTFSYARPDLEGLYTYRSAYYNPKDPEGSHALDETDTLDIDLYGTATHRYTYENANGSLGYAVDDGVISYFYGEYYFVITSSGENYGGMFNFLIGKDGDTPYFTSSYGEAGAYYKFDTPDGMTGSLGDGNLVLDGYGNISFYDAVFTGFYWVDDMYSNGLYVLYRINAIVQDNAGNQARDLLGYDTWQEEDGNYYFYLEFYTIPLSDDTYGYVEPHVEAGEYEAVDSNASLVLDGYRNFADSAVYTDGNGNVHRGLYTIAAMPSGTLIVTIYENTPEGLYTGRDYTLRLVADGDRFVLADGEEAQSSIEYLLLEDAAFDYTMVLAIYDENYEGVQNAKKAVILIETSKGTSQYQTAATGYVTLETLKGSRAHLYTFVRDELKEGYLTEDIPSKLVFMLSSTYDGDYYFSHDVYYVFEYTFEDGDGVETVGRRYSVATDVNGSDAVIWYMDVGVNSMGSVYFDANGVAYAGGLIVDTTNYFFGDIGIFSSIDPSSGNVDTFYFQLDLDAEGLPVGFEEITELEYAAYGFNADGSLNGEVHLLLRGNQALYSANGFNAEAADSVLCNVVVSGRTAFGDSIIDIVTVEGGVKLFSAVRDYILYLDIFEYVEIWVYYEYRPEVATTFTAGGAKLITDGYRRASYTDIRGNTVEGTFTLGGTNGNVIYFTSNAGDTFIFGLEGSSFRVLDGVYGSYDLYYLGQWYTLAFDGQGNVTARIGNVVVGEGIYDVLDANTTEVNLYLDLNGERVSLHVALGYDGFVVINEKLTGVFINDEWAVLYLDGKGGGSYHSADGSVGVRAYYTVVSGEDGYISVRDENFNYYNFLLDSEKHTFSRPVFVQGGNTYYAEDFSALSFDRNGEVYFSRTTGFYQILNGNTRIYLPEDDFGMSYSVLDVVGVPANANYTVNGKTYYPYVKGQEITFTGTVELDDGGEGFSSSATLTFAPDGDVQFYVPGTFTVGDKSYDVMVINQYWDYRANVYRGLALYDASIYEYSPFTSYSYNPAGQSTFTVSGGRVETVMYDGFEEDEDSSLTESYVGFGPIHLTDTILKGSIHVSGTETLTFSGAKVDTVLYNAVDMGNRYMAVFESGGKTYSVQYHKFDGDYWLYMVATHETVQAGEYTVGVGSFYYSSGGFIFPTSVGKGTPFSVTLYHGGSAIVAYNSYLNTDAEGNVTSGWVLALGSYDIATDTGEIGSIYAIDFADGMSSATVTEHSVKQATGSSVGVSYFANFFLDDDGNIVAPASLAVNVGGGYEFLVYISVEKTGENEWTFYAKDGYDYTMTLLTDEDGGYKSDETGEYWQIALTAVKHEN